MTVDSIGAVEPVGRPHKGIKSDISRNVESDGVHLSAEARDSHEIDATCNLVKELPPTREQVVADAKERINDVSYLHDPHILNVAAERIAGLLSS